MRIAERMDRTLTKETLLACIAIASVVLITYHPALNLGFYSDDWIFYDLAGRLSLSDYLAKYLDPRVQTTWYRPIQGILFRLESIAFGSNPLNYHLLNILFHLANSWLLFALVQRITHSRRIGLSSAFLFASLPTAALAVLWPGVVDTLETLFYISSIWLWLSHVQTGKQLDYWCAFGTFLLALLTKETAVTLPIVLVLVDRCWVQKPASVAKLARRYVWFGLTWIVYLPIEYIVSQRSIFLSREGYQFGINTVWTFIDYLSTLTFPWAFVMWLSHAGLAIVIAFLMYSFLSKRKLVLLPLLVGCVLVVLPVAPFPLVVNRFLYLPLLVSMAVYALLFERLWLGLSRHWFYQASAIAALILVITDGSGQVLRAINDFGEWQRDSYVTFNNVIRMHPTLPDDTLFYFLDPPVPGPTLSGMFLQQYGPGVLVGANDSDQLPRLGDHQKAFVVYFDAQGQVKELPIEREMTQHVFPQSSVSFNRLITLQDYEITKTQIKTGENLGLLVHWHTVQSFIQAYSVSIRLINAQGDIVVSETSVPREWREFASRRQAGEAVVDAHILTIPRDIPGGSYQLELTLCDPTTLERLPIMDSDGHSISDKIVIHSIEIEN